MIAFLFLFLIVALINMVAFNTWLSVILGAMMVIFSLAMQFKLRRRKRKHGY